MSRRAVLFDLGGVLFGPGLQHHLGSCERDCALPSNFLRDVLLAGGPDSPHAKVMRGQITLSQLFSEVEEGCKQHASAAGIALPPTFSIARAFEEMAAKGAVNAPLLRAAGVLRRNGFKTGIFTNNWVDDSTGRLFTATLLGALRRHFDVVIESCRAGLHKPDPRLYAHALEVLQAKPQDVILLDDIGENLKPAREMGMATILVRDTETVLKELQELSGVQLLHQDEPLPTACDPADVSHGYVPIRPGVQLHFVEMGQGPAVCLCHGFPEVWLSWRYQIPALADAGFRVIALEMKGYGESTAPPGPGGFPGQTGHPAGRVHRPRLGRCGGLEHGPLLPRKSEGRGLAQHPVPARGPRRGHSGEDEKHPHLRLPVLLPGAGRRGGRAGEGRGAHAEGPDPLHPPGGPPALRAQLPRHPEARGAAGRLPRKPSGEPDPARPRAAVLHPALPEVRLQGSAELVPEHAAQLALGARRQGQEDPDARADGDGGEGRGAAPQHEQGHGGVGAAAAPGTPRGVWPLDADGEAGGAEQDPGGVAGGAPRRRGRAQGVPAVSGAGGGPRPRTPCSRRAFPCVAPTPSRGLPVLWGCARRVPVPAWFSPGGLDALMIINAAAEIAPPPCNPWRNKAQGDLSSRGCASTVSPALG